jgi:hypothetical protein
MANVAPNTNAVASDAASIPDDTTFLAGELVPNFLGQIFSGVAYCRMLYRDGKPDDFIYLYTNPAFHQQTGLGPVSGKRASEAISGIRESDPELLVIYGRVSRFQQAGYSLKQPFQV